MEFGQHDRFCFVITPLGAKDSPERVRFEKVLKNIITPALRNSGMRIISALDFGPQTIITNEVISHVINAQLCIVDISDSNPNVMYELGIRRQTGRPYLTIKNMESKPPFDIMVEKYLEYDFSDFETVVETLDQISKRVSKIDDESENLEPPASIPTLMRIVQRMEKQVQALSSRLGNQSAGSSVQGDIRTQSKTAGVGMNAFMPPRERFDRALKSGDVNAAIEAVKYWLASSGPSEEIVWALGIVSRTGSPEIQSVLSAYRDWVPDKADSFLPLFSSAQSIYEYSDDKEGLCSLVSDLEDHFESFLVQDGSEAQNKTLGRICNQIGMFWWSAKDADKADVWTRKAIEYADNEPAYWHNLSFSTKDRQGVTEALKLAVKAYELGVENDDLDDTHIDRIVGLHIENENYPEARQYNETLRAVNPSEAQTNDGIIKEAEVTHPS